MCGEVETCYAGTKAFGKTDSRDNILSCGDRAYSGRGWKAGRAYFRILISLNQEEMSAGKHWAICKQKLRVEETVSGSHRGGDETEEVLESQRP